MRLDLWWHSVSLIIGLSVMSFKNTISLYPTWWTWTFTTLDTWFQAAIWMQVKGLTQLMHTQFYRDRLVHTHFKGTVWANMFSSWEAGAFIPWRWGSLVNVCKGLWRRKGPLTTMWSSIKFTCGNTWSGSSASSGMLSKASEAIESGWFWAYLDFILLCAGALEELSSWCEGCTCHGHRRPGCPFKGRRAPELATGRFSIFLKEQCSLVSALFVAASAALDDQSRAVLMQEWQTAMQVITSTLRVQDSKLEGFALDLGWSCFQWWRFGKGYR